MGKKCSGVRIEQKTFERAVIETVAIDGVRRPRLDEARHGGYAEIHGAPGRNFGGLSIDPRLARVAWIVIHQPHVMTAPLQGGQQRLQILLHAAH
jgi:hypothetical protein